MPLWSWPILVGEVEHVGFPASIVPWLWEGPPPPGPTEPSQQTRRAHSAPERGRRPPKATPPPADPGPGGAVARLRCRAQPPYLLWARQPKPGPPRESVRAGPPRRADADPGPQVSPISHCCRVRPRAPPSGISVQRLVVACAPPPVLVRAELRHRQYLV
ncbi:hypothetical protein NDU88_001383 [Pleurodeles waltl]|uniref:Uncharacterized protein n=1 Tax=Pleurodeles waltl TaxID=8319 RepID=A0AAV7UUK9_PLEWA|nr:hypothetical protein NDU88_001383 [Pleurodeles waltl]